MYLLAILTHIIALSLDEILKRVIPHMDIQYIFDFTLLIAVNNHR
jgi:hypothetical protein